MDDTDDITGKSTIEDLCDKWAVADTTAYKKIERLVSVVKNETLRAMERRKG